MHYVLAKSALPVEQFNIYNMSTGNNKIVHIMEWKTLFA